MPGAVLDVANVLSVDEIRVDKRAIRAKSGGRTLGGRKAGEGADRAAREHSRDAQRACPGKRPDLRPTLPPTQRSPPERGRAAVTK